MINSQQHLFIDPSEAMSLLLKAQTLLSNCPDGHFLQTEEEYMKECYETAEKIEKALNRKDLKE